MGLERAQRPEAARQPRDVELPETLDADVLEPVTPEVAQGEIPRQ